MRVEDIPYEIDGIAMIGHLAVPDDAGPRPAVLVCHEGNGLSPHVKERTEALAELGYAAFALDYLGGGGRVDDETAWSQLSKMMEDPAITRGRGEAGFRLLLEQPETDPARVAVIGYCMGGVMAFELARGGVDVKAAVGFHPGGLASRPDDTRTITASVLMCIGTDDPFLTRDQRIEFEQEMLDAEVADWRIELYGGVAHSFTNPDAASAGMPGVEYHQPSARRSWQSMRNLFAETIDA
jgi:dienelactone hydrolase